MLPNVGGTKWTKIPTIFGNSRLTIAESLDIISERKKTMILTGTAATDFLKSKLDDRFTFVFKSYMGEPVVHTSRLLFENLEAPSQYKMNSEWRYLHPESPQLNFESPHCLPGIFVIFGPANVEKIELDSVEDIVYLS